MRLADRLEPLRRAAAFLAHLRDHRILAMLCLLYGAALAGALALRLAAGGWAAMGSLAAVVELAAGLALLAAGGAFLVAPGLRTEIALYLALGASVIALVAAWSWLAAAGAPVTALFIVDGLIALVLAGWLVRYVLRDGRSLDRFRRAPPARRDLEEIAALARRAAEADPGADPAVIEFRQDKRRWRLWLAEDAALFVRGDLRVVLLARREDVYYGAAPPRRGSEDRCIVFCGPAENQNEPVTLSAEALARLAAWKPPESDVEVRWE